MQINNLKARIESNREIIMNAIDTVLNSGWVILGPQLKRFEAAFADYLGVTHCVGVANGTDAIELALRALGIKYSNRVATVANAGMYSTNAIRSIGAEPFFIDVDFETRNTTTKEVARAIQSGVNAVIVTHLYGLATPEILEISQLCSQAGIPLLEDCAQAHGARLGSKLVGSFGDAASFSFYPTKNLGAFGDGGQSPQTAQILRKLWLGSGNMDGHQNTEPKFRADVTVGSMKCKLQFFWHYYLI